MENKEFEQKSKLLNFLEKWLMILIWFVKFYNEKGY